MKRITPNLWFDKEAKAAAEFYSSLFENSRITYAAPLKDTPAGEGAEMVSFEIDGQPFMAISAGPTFKLNPTISFILNFDPARWSDADIHLNRVWRALAEGGRELMPLDKYFFSPLYGWIQDKYGVSWQLMLTDPKGEKRPFVTPALLFTGPVLGRAEEAINFYCAIFEDGKRGATTLYPQDMPPNQPGTLMYGDFRILGTWLAAMDSVGPHEFNFNEALSLLIPCETQEEIDYYWQKLSADPQAEQCGWLKDKFGVSWQVWPTALGEMMSQGTPEQVARMTHSFLKMKKFDLAELKRVFAGK